MAVDPTELERRFAELAEAGLQQRADGLRQLQDSDPELAKRLASLLDAHGATSDPLDRLRGEAIRQLSAFDADALIGRELGGWTLQRLLGKGGMGVVYAASRQQDGIEQRAALKLLSAPTFDARAGERFTAEARALSRLDHPGICRLRNWGRSAEGWNYLVLDLIDGHPLSTALDGRSLDQRLRAMADIADAVAAAHRQLVAHLDLKPANVLITADGHPVLLDFGVARVLNDDDAGGATLTRWLTPRYASPEQLRGEPASASADIYALGVMLYEQVTGGAPFVLDGVSVTEALRRIEAGATPPSRLTAGLSRDLDAICARAMHADPARRYASADAFADDLRALLDRRPVSARPDSLGYRLSRLFARHPIAMPAGLLAVLAVATLTVLLAFQASDLKQQRDRAERAAARARAVSELLIGSIKAADPSGEHSNTLTLQQLMEATSRRMRLELAEEPDLLAEGLVGIGNAREALGQHSLALGAYGEAIDLMQRARYPLHDQLDARLGRLDALTWSDQLDAAVGEAEALLAQVDQADRWRVQAALGSLYVRSGKVTEADAVLSAAAEAAPTDAHEQRVTLFNSLGSSLSHRGQLKEAMVWYDRALSEFAMTNGGNPDDEAVVRMNRAKLNAEVGDGDAALADVERALAIRQKLFGENHHLLVQTLGFQSVVLTDIGRYDQAKAAARRAIASLEQIQGGVESRQMALQLQALGGAQLRAEEYEDARDSMLKALGIYALHLPEEHAEVAAVRNNLAAAYNGLGDHRHALEEMRKVWDVYRALSPDKPTVYLAMIASNVADAYAKLGEGTNGVEWSRRALEQAATTLPADHWITGNLHSVLASNLLLTGDLDAALSAAVLGEKLISAAKTPVQPSLVRENLQVLTRIHQARDEPEQAARFAERAAALDPDVRATPSP